MSKGSTPRKVERDKFNAEYDRIFNKKPKPAPKSGDSYAKK